MAAEISAKIVKELRDKTSAGMMDCKKALQEADGDFAKAEEALKKKGLATAEKKSGRAATEGIVEAYIHMGGKLGILVEVNCETDFVARRAEFQELARNIAMQIAACPQVQYINTADIPMEIAEQEKKIELEMAVVLNIYQDHIDWHETFEQYVFSKLKIFNFSTNQKYNFLGPVDSQVKTEEILPKNVRNFNEEKFNLNNYFDDFVSIFIDVCKEFSIPKDEVLNFLTSQSSIKHRFELFHTKNGVKFINDSKSTNLESVNKASYKVKNCLLIMHGLLKGIDSNNFLVVEYENFEDLKNLFFLMYLEYESVYGVNNYTFVKHIFIDGGLIQFALVFIFVSLLFKLAVAPFHL